jgi:hypothetical protein
VQALEQNARKRVCGHGAARRAGLNVQVELWRGGLAWASTRTARPHAWRTWWWSGVGDRSRCGVGQARTQFGRVREQRGKAEASDAELLRKNRRRVAGLLREMREHGGVDPDYATVIFVGVGAEQKRRTGGAIKRGNPAGSYTGVPAVFQWHTCVGKRRLSS